MEGLDTSSFSFFLFSPQSLLVWLHVMLLTVDRMVTRAHGAFFVRDINDNS